MRDDNMRRRILLLILLIIALITSFAGCSMPAETNMEASEKSLYDQGLEITSVVKEMAGSRAYLDGIGAVEEIRPYLQNASAGYYAIPKDVYCVTVSQSDIYSGYEIDPNDLTDELQSQFVSQGYRGLISCLNAQQGTACLAASNCCIARKTFTCTDFSENVIYIYTFINSTPVGVIFTAGENNSVLAEGYLIFQDDIDVDGEESVAACFEPVRATVKKVADTNE